MSAIASRTRRLLGSRLRSIVALEALLWLGGAGLLLAQIACVETTAVDPVPENIHLADATFTPAFVGRRSSLPALVRYWLPTGESVTVTWPEIRIARACNLCRRAQECPNFYFRPGDYGVTVNHRPPDSDSVVEDARFGMLDGCPGVSNLPSFSPTGTGDYLAHFTVAGTAPIPSEPGKWLRMNVLSTSFTLPPRLMQPGAQPDEWIWTAKGDSTTLKEAFHPDLRVGKVRVLVGTCATPPAQGREDECGADLLMDPAFTMRQVIAPQYVRVRSLDVSVQDCHGEASAPDGDIDLGPDPNSPRSSRCRPRFDLVRVTPNYNSLETQAGAPLTWRVVFSAEDGFPLPDPGQQVWIEFTLVPAP